MFKVDLVAINPKDEERRTPPISVTVDTGAEYSWLPAKILMEAGIFPRQKKYFSTATNQIVERDTGFAIVTAEGFTTNEEVVFGIESDEPLLGVRTIEGFSVMVDNLNHKLIPTISRVTSFYRVDESNIDKIDKVNGTKWREQT